ncbi:hypothetical protein [Streptomyces sp. LBL]|nr:hypothetical protein [Streptomyces sp. LBL]
MSRRPGRRPNGEDERDRAHDGEVENATLDALVTSLQPAIDALDPPPAAG